MRTCPVDSPLVDGQPLSTPPTKHPTVRQRVLTTPRGLLGGRHRSVALADAIAARINTSGIGVEVEHLDIDQPILDR